MGIKSKGGGFKPGFMADFAGGVIPAGWLECAGQAVSRTTYAALFLAIGTTHGAGDGVSTFNLPDSRGRAVFGKDDMNGTPANRITNAVSGIVGTNLGAVGGGQSHTLTSAEIASHTHSTWVYSGASYSSNGAGVVLGVTSGNTGVGGSGGAHRNLPPALIANKIIKI